MKMRIVILGLAGAFLILNSPVLATERLVPSQYPTIQAAIDDCNNGDVVIAEPNIYTGPGNRDIDFKGLAITVRSTDPNDPNIVAATVIDCNGSFIEPHRGFYFHSGEDVNSVLDGLTITNGYAVTGGAALCDSSAPTVSNCMITNNSAGKNVSIKGYGGGIYCDDSEPIIKNCTIENNLSFSGGGIYCIQSSPIISNCAFIENTAMDGSGGGMYNYNGSSPKLTSCVFIGNTIGGSSGGGMYNNKESNATITNCIFIENSAPWGSGGGMCSYDDSSPMVTNCTFSGNSAGRGGGMYNSWYSSPTVTNCIFWCDTASQCQEISGASISVSYSDVQGGYAGTGNIDADPCFVMGPGGDYYLSQTTAGQVVDSPCVDAGSDFAIYLGMEQSTTRTDDVNDIGIADMGYHYGDYNPARPFDFDEDGDIDFVDFSILALQWQQAPGVPSADIAPPGGDNIVDVLELELLVRNWLWEE